MTSSVLGIDLITGENLPFAIFAAKGLYIIGSTGTLGSLILSEPE